MTRQYTASRRPQPDAAALAAIRPGMAGDALRAAFGPGWREPAPHKGGVVDIAQGPLGFSARLDVDGNVGEIAYEWHFPASVAVLGLRIGMSIAEVVAAMPGLEVGPPMAFRASYRMGQVRRDGTTINVGFHTESLHDIRMWNPDAVYREPGPPPYPPADAPPVAPFVDSNFKLVVLSNLIESKTIDLGTPTQFFEHVLGRPYNKKNEPFGEIAEARAYLDRFELTPELLAAVEELCFDGGNDIYSYLADTNLHDWDALEVTDLSGIELLPNVTQFNANSGVSEVDLRALVPLRHLVELDAGVDCTHFEALLDMPSLKSCQLMGNDVYADVTESGHPIREIMETLKARGVKVWVHWISHESPGPPGYT